MSIASSFLVVNDTAKAQEVSPGFNISVFAHNGFLATPQGLEFGNNGDLFVANNTENGQQGNILRIDSSGNQSIYSSTFNQLLGPYDLAFSPGGSFGSQGDLFVTLEDRNDAGVFPSDGVARVTPAGTASLFVDDLEETGGIEFAKQNGFGENMYVASRTQVHEPNMDYPLRLFEIGPGGAKTQFTVMNGGDEVTGVWSFQFSDGGAFGPDMYLSTFADLPHIDPDAIDAIYRVDAAGNATLMASDANFLFAEFSDGGRFGEFLYYSSGSEVFRMDASGNIASIASGFSSARGLTFGPDGSLYVADKNANAIYRISAAIPEPSGAMLAIVALIAASCTRRRR